MEPITAGAALISENGPWVIEQAFWNLLWIASGVCAFGLIFSFAEQLWTGPSAGTDAIVYEGSKRMIGLPLVAIGLLGVIGCAVAWSSVTGNIGRAFELLMKHNADTANAFEKLDLWLVVASIMVFIAGAILTLGSERPAPRV